MFLTHYENVSIQIWKNYFFLRKRNIVYEEAKRIKLIMMIVRVNHATLIWKITYTELADTRRSCLAE